MNENDMLSAIADVFDGLSARNEQRERQRASGDDGDLSVPQTLPRLSLSKRIQLSIGIIALIAASVLCALIGLGGILAAMLSSRNVIQIGYYSVIALLLSSFAYYCISYIRVVRWQARGRNVRPRYDVWLYQTLALCGIALLVVLLYHAGADRNNALLQRLLYVMGALGGGGIAWWPIRVLISLRRQRTWTTHR